MQQRIAGTYTAVTDVLGSKDSQFDGNVDTKLDSG